MEVNFYEFFLGSYKKDLSILKIDSFLKAIQKAENLLLKSLRLIENINEADVWDMIENFEDSILRNKKFQQYMLDNYKAKIIKDTIEEPDGFMRSKGGESVGYFFRNNIVVKYLFSGDYMDEMKIANTIMGKVETVPILDVMFAKNSVTQQQYPIIIMKKLETNPVERSGTIKIASSIIADWCLNVQQKIVEQPDIQVEEIKDLLSINKIIEVKKPLKTIQQAMQDILTIVHDVYNESGYLIGGDYYQGSNLGFEAKSKKIKTFDLGRSIAHKPQETKSIKTITF